MHRNTGDKKSPKRNYSSATIKILFAFSGNRCAVPNCPNPVVKAATASSKQVVIGEICHIYAASDIGPRGKPGLTDEERNAPENLLICCPTHHVVVDKQYETYPASMLLEWKARLERAYGERISSRMNSIGYAELEVAAKALLTASVVSGVNASVIPPKDKIQKNGLSATVEMLLTMGAAKSKEVAEVLVKGAQLDSNLPDRLRNGFVEKYEELWVLGSRKDDLFFGLYDWASGDEGEARQAAGLCILAHLFVICDVFEK